MAWEFWIDRGGTFTDIVAKDPAGRLHLAKYLSQAPGRYDDAALAAIRDFLGLSPGAKIPQAQLARVKMGTTVATNALLERQGARTLLLITEGFGDLLEIGYQTRPALFDLAIRRPLPLYEKVVEVSGRFDAKGQEIAPLQEAALCAALAAARVEGSEAVAIAFIHAAQNPAHEARAAELAKEAGFTQISQSHAVSGLARFIARADTAVIDAYLSPPLKRYVAQMQAALGAPLGRGKLYFMQSNGGLAEAAHFSGKDAVLSGPAGGLVGMVKTGLAAGYDRLIGFDMGGTSTDVSHYAGRYERRAEATLAGARLAVPMLDIHTVAAGGGSICGLRDGRLFVGPASAGADPGPAAYQRGGPLTVTDCNLMLGRLSPAYFPAVFGPKGDAPLALAPVKAKLAQLAEDWAALTGKAPPLEALAEDFRALAVEHMAQAIKKISVERGYDVKDYTLHCFGGAGGQHACAVAGALGMRRVFLHPFAGVLSAYGMGLATLGLLRQAAFDAPLTETANARMRLAALAAEARAALRAQGERQVQITRRAYLRYAGAPQSLPVLFGAARAMRRAFEEAHRARFGFLRRGEALVFDLLEVEATGLSPSLPEAVPPPANGAATSLGQSQLWWQGAWAPMPIYARGDLPVGAALRGPALISDPAGTVIVDPGWRALCDPQGNLILEADVQRQYLAEADDSPTPARLERWGNFYMALAEEMGVTLASTAWSVNIKERLDFSCALFDAAGDLVANAPHVPVHLGSMSDAVKAVIAKTQGRVEEGSAYALNSPYDGGTHLPDVTLVTPVLWQGQAVAWLGSRGHHADIGGRTPGSSPPDSHDIAEEGILLPVTQVVRRGKLLRAALLKRLTAGPYPCRAPLHNVADLEAQIAANETGRRALLEALARPGGGAALTFMRHLQANAEEAVRALIADLPEGAFTLTHDNGARIAVELRIDRKARRATLDFTGTSPQQPGNFNAPLAVIKAVVLYVFRCLLGRALPLNDGCLRPLTLIVPEGTLLNPRPPAAVIAGNTEVSQTLCNALLAALGAAAASQGTMNNFVWGNARFQNYETIAGGAGAGPGFAGASAVQTHMTNTRMTDPEVLERRFPVRLEHFGFRQGSGGAGRWPGGEGLKRRLRFLDAVTVTVLCGARVIPPFGMAGGGPGACGVNRAISADGQVTPLGGHAEIDLPAGAAFEMETPGGGGWGAPD